MGTNGNDLTPPTADFSGEAPPGEIGPAPVLPYQLLKHREDSRRAVALILLALLAAEALGAIIALCVGVSVSSTRALLEVIFGPTATLTGTVTAFYFAIDRHN